MPFSLSISQDVKGLDRVDRDTTIDHMMIVNKTSDARQNQTDTLVQIKWKENEQIIVTHKLHYIVDCWMLHLKFEDTFRLAG